MTFISYAQNFEDIMLWRAFRHVKNGFYIDVGANDPTVDSVTKAFYERGWRGINIEPLESHYKDLQVERPRDINLCCAAGETSGEIEIFECDIRGWATAEKSYAKKLVQEGHEGVYHSVPLRTLSDICQEYISGEIHFLKIDVEGMEKQVISGADFQKFRPWIVFVEAMEPNSTQEAHKRWEGQLVADSYKFVYADGLNRFYVASERTSLLPAFKYPPNVFDDYMLSSNQQNAARAQKLQSELEAAKVHAGHLTVQLNEKSAALSGREATLAEQRAHNQRLESEGNDAKARIAELNAVFKETLARQHEAQIAAGKAAARAQKLQSELEAAKVHAGHLTAQLGITEGENARIKIELLAQQQSANESDVALNAGRKRAQWLENEWNAANFLVNKLQTDLDAVHAANHHHWQLSEACGQQIQAIYQSYSWRITKPLRLLYLGLGKTVSSICMIPKWIWRTFKWPFQLILAFMIRLISKRPAIVIKVTAWLKRYPRLETRLCQFARARGLVPTLKVPETIPKQIDTTPIVETVADFSYLSPRARQIYADLKAAIESRQKEIR